MWQQPSISTLGCRLWRPFCPTGHACKKRTYRNTSSIAGIVPLPSQAAYCATKHAVTALTESLRYEFFEEGIAFTTICPSNVATAIFGKADIPQDAIPAEEAARIILEGVEKKEGIVIFPAYVKKMYERALTDQAFKEKFLLEYARRRNDGWRGVPYLGAPMDLMEM